MGSPMPPRAPQVAKLRRRSRRRTSVDGPIHYICMDWRHMSEMLAAGEVFTELKNLIIWGKGNGGMGTFHRYHHELVFALKKSTGPHINTFELGQHRRYRSNVWQCHDLQAPCA